MEYLHRVYGNFVGTYQTGAKILKIIASKRYRENFLDSGGSELLMLWMLSALAPNTDRNIPTSSRYSSQVLDDRIK